jgi:hypothetical protein
MGVEALEKSAGRRSFRSGHLISLAFTSFRDTSHDSGISPCLYRR